MSKSTSPPFVGCPGGPTLPPKEQLKEKIDLLRARGQVYKTDVLVVGSGPIGAVFARKLVVEGNQNVLMIEMGEQASKRIGDHRKNSVAVQKDISLFTNIIKGELSPLSVSMAEASTHLPPEWTPELTSDEVPKKNQFVLNGQNPEQRPEYNLAASAATRTLGGMASHWTCCTPRQYPDFAGDLKGRVERSELFTGDEWESLYHEAEELFGTNPTRFDNSVRHRLVKKILEENFTKNGDRVVQSMPLACEPGRKKGIINWSCTASILGDELSNPDRMDKPAYSKLLTVRAQTQLDTLLIEDDDAGKGASVTCAVIIDLETGLQYVVDAQRYVICGGTVLTAGILAQSLFKSGLEKEEHRHIGRSYLPTLGRYLTEQTMTFCQVVLKKTHVDRVSETPGGLDVKRPDGKQDHTIRNAVKKHKAKHQNTGDDEDDTLPFPFDDLDPNVYIPFTEKYPWHTQIHRDAFGYGEVPADVDQRLIVDLRFFGYVEPNKFNRIDFSAKRRDGFGMPQPTFWFSLGKGDVERSTRMMKDMVEVATSLGQFLPGAEPRYLAPGLALHICGIYRAGEEVQDKNGEFDLEKTKENSVVSKTGQVWGVGNLYLGGCGVIPTANATNPTLTAACHAIAGADQIIKELGK